MTGHRVNKVSRHADFAPLQRRSQAPPPRWDRHPELIVRTLWRKRIAVHDIEREGSAATNAGCRRYGRPQRKVTNLMGDAVHGEVTVLLREVNAGRRDAFGRLMALIYPQLRLLARSHFRR